MALNDLYSVVVERLIAAPFSGNYSVKLVHRCLVGGLLRFVQRGGDLAHPRRPLCVPNATTHRRSTGVLIVSEGLIDCEWNTSLLMCLCSSVRTVGVASANELKRC